MLANTQRYARNALRARLSYTRALSNQVQDQVYGGPQARSNKRFTLTELKAKYTRDQPISMCTAYTYPSAVHVCQAGIDMLLVGDSVAMVELGHDTTLPVTMDNMIYHAQAVARGAVYPLLIGDMPFGSYEESPEQAMSNAVRFLKEANMDAVKLEGGRSRAETIRRIVDGGVSVMGHIGLTPQRISVLGGFKPQGKSADQAYDLLKDAEALQQSGCFSIVLECVPERVAEQVTKAIDIPTIGIGAGSKTSGQVLVYHDLLGMLMVAPKFMKRYADIGDAIQKGLDQYRREVEAREFPSAQYSPYKIADEEFDAFLKMKENGK